MKYSTNHNSPHVGRRYAVAGSALAAVLAAGLVVVSANSASAAATLVGLGTADSFVVLAGSGITNTGASTLNGDIGTFPTTTIVPGSMTVNGTNQAGNSITQGAKTDLVTAYNAAAGQGPASPIVADLGGTTLVAGVYNSATSVGLTGTLTLDGQGNTSGVWVFQAGSTLTTAAASRVLLVNGAQPCNVFWQVGSSATLGTTTSFVGSILALTSITLTTGATVNGRVLARNGAVTLDTNTITKPTCAPVAPTWYAANVGPGAQGLVCPWGGRYNGAGLCDGTGANSLTNPSPTPSPSATPIATPSPIATPAALPPTVVARPLKPNRPQLPAAQVPKRPLGGVDTGNSSTG